MSNCNTVNTVTNTGSNTRTASWARRGIVAIALGSMFFAACSADEISSSAEDTAPTESEAAAAESVLTEPSATAPATAPPATAPAATTPATTTPVTTQPTTTTPAPPPATDPPAPNPPPNTNPPATDAPAPVFQSFSASNVSECAAPDVSIVIERTVTLSWEIEGADSVYVAIDNVNGPYETNLPAVGSLQVPVSCPEDSIFYVVAENAAGRTVMEATR